MKKEKIQNTEVTAEEIVTVTAAAAAAVDVATQGEIAAAKLSKKSAEKEPKLSKKSAEKELKDAAKLQKAKFNSEGKMVIKTYVASDGMQVYYIVQEGLKNERLYNVTAEALITSGKAITITREEFQQMLADEKASKKAEAEIKKSAE